MKRQERFSAGEGHADDYGFLPSATGRDQRQRIGELKAWKPGDDTIFTDPSPRDRDFE
jgi:hypothetical protein